MFGWVVVFSGWGDYCIVCGGDVKCECGWRWVPGFALKDVKLVGLLCKCPSMFSSCVSLSVGGWCLDLVFWACLRRVWGGRGVVWVGVFVVPGSLWGGM